MKKYFIILIITLTFCSPLFANLGKEEEDFINKIQSSENLTKERIILKKDELKKLQIPMGNKYKKNFFLLEGRQ